jgi:hypothetical protein
MHLAWFHFTKSIIAQRELLTARSIAPNDTVINSEEIESLLKI